MTVYKTEAVFGVSKDPVLSYVERSDVDGMFVSALKTDKQIIVYGASKQGKTSLVEKHLPYKENVIVSLTPKFQLIDIYKSVLSALGINLVTNSATCAHRAVDAGEKLGVQAMWRPFCRATSSA